MPNQPYEPTGLTYSVKTIEEFAALVTKENLPLILKDFESTLQALIDMDVLVKQACEVENIPYQRLIMEAFNWIDDGKHHLSEITISSAEDPSDKIVFKPKE